MFSQYLVMDVFIKKIAKQERLLFSVFSGITLGCIFVALLIEAYPLLVVPPFLLLIYFTAVDFRAIFFLLLFCIPLSMEINLPNGFGTDLPTEPLIVGLMFVYFLYMLRHAREMNNYFFRHPITILLFLHLSWIGIATMQSSQMVVSVKYLLAKIWYLVTFYFLAAHLLKKQEDIKKMFWVIFVPLLLTIVIILVRHAPYGFSFESVFRVLHPFYRNHVAYAAVMATFIPFIWFALFWQKPYSFSWWALAGALVLLLVAIQLAYTRAAYVAVLAAVGAYFVIRWRLTKVAIAGSVLLVGLLVGYLSYNNRYLDFAPNYERTITHKDFGNLLEATYQLEDISTVERVYRWIAGFYMSKEKPVFGFGPGNFYFFYHSYTVNSFRTYVSHNPEKSGIHSYYLMVLVEQGFFGLFIFMALVFIVLVHGERIYHQTTDIRDRQIVMMALLSFIIILILMIINDLVETDKVGSFFFINMALLVNIDVKNRKKLPEATNVK